MILGYGQHTISWEVAQVEPRGRYAWAIRHLWRNVVHQGTWPGSREHEEQRRSEGRPGALDTAVDTKPEEGQEHRCKA